MDKFKIALLTGVVTPAIFAACLIATGKDYSNTRKIVWLTANSFGKTTTVYKGTTIILRLTNQPDGGYVLDSIAYNKAILRLIKHIEKSPPANSRLGYSGKALWQFIALKAGMSIIKVTASRPWNRKDTAEVYFSNLKIR